VIVLDTSAAIELLDGTPAGITISKHLETELAGASVVTLNELLVGSHGNKRTMVESLFKSLQLLPADEAIARKAAIVEEVLERKGRPIQKLDTFIAATCLVHQIPLITCDKGFKNVDGLHVILIEK
jgi:tRNA(fMet)-specific endonuclease VapC